MQSSSLLTLPRDLHDGTLDTQLVALLSARECWHQAQSEARTLISKMCFDILPVSYFLIRIDSSPCLSEGVIGVYGRMTGLPLSSRSVSDFVTTHDATRSIEDWLSGSSKTKVEVLWL